LLAADIGSVCQSNRVEIEAMHRSREVAALVMYLCAVSAAGAVDSKNPFFVSVCTDDQAAGFSWKSGKWQPAQFNASSFLAERRSPDVDNECVDIIATKMAIEDPARMNFDPYSFTYGCYNVRPYAAQFNPLFNRACWEAWEVIKGVNTLTRVDCTEGFDIISFAPDGNYNHAVISSQITNTPPLDRKSSLMVSVGKCEVQ